MSPLTHHTNEVKNYILGQMVKANCSVVLSTAIKHLHSPQGDETDSVVSAHGLVGRVYCTDEGDKQVCVPLLLLYICLSIMNLMPMFCSWSKSGYILLKSCLGQFALQSICLPSYDMPGDGGKIPSMVSFINNVTCIYQSLSWIFVFVF